MSADRADYHRAIAVGAVPPKSPKNPRVILGTAERDWVDAAACKGADVKDWFPLEAFHKNARVRLAISVCMECPVRLACLEWAIETREQYGIWGGMTEPERSNLVRRRRARARKAVA